MERRKFIGTLGLGALGVYLTGCASAAAETGGMGVQLYSVRDAVAQDLEKALERLAAIGYNKLEIYGYNGSFFGKTAAEFNAILKNTGMRVVSSHHITGLSQKSNGSLTVGWEKAVEDVQAIGGAYMACAYLFPDERTPEIYAALPELLNKSGEVSKKGGIQFAYHNHDFEFLPYQDTIAYDHLITQTSADLVKMELDLYWISKAGHDAVAYFEKYPGRFPLWHVKDMEAGSGDITEVGNGTVDFQRIFAARDKAGLKEWFVEQDVSKGDMFESLTKSRTYLLDKKL